MELAGRSCTPPPRGKPWLVLLLLLAVSLLFVHRGEKDQSSWAAQQKLKADGHGETQSELRLPHLELGFVAESQELESFPR